jgi:hypothetical protein
MEDSALELALIISGLPRVSLVLDLHVTSPGRSEPHPLLGEIHGGDGGIKHGLPSTRPLPSSAFENLCYAGPRGGTAFLWAR